MKLRDCGRAGVSTVAFPAVGKPGCQCLQADSIVVAQAESCSAHSPGEGQSPHRAQGELGGALLF